MKRRALAAVLALCAYLAPSAAAAHGFHPGSLVLRETAPGVFAMSWTAPVDTAASVGPLSLDFPDHCRAGAAELDCAPAGLRGTLAVRGLVPERGQVAVWIRFADGRDIDALLTAAAPRLVIDRAPGPAPRVWLGLGAEHALTQPAPLAVLLALVLLVGRGALAALAATAAAFAAAWILGLALAGAALLPLVPAAAILGAGVLLLAREALGERPTLPRRAPQLAALVVGVVAGLASGQGARALGLPPSWELGAVACFGAGALAVLLGAAAAAQLGIRAAGERWPRLAPAACYALGGAGAFWLIEGALTVLTAGS